MVFKQKCTDPGMIRFTREKRIVSAKSNLKGKLTTLEQKAYKKNSCRSITNLPKFQTDR